ncbi:uncharacterized protein LOC115882023 [Sitophilus oryzae]|uniref:Proteasome assembly chaperone 1 n=1 Tax=Sitophilus oryzae TaxID=7048 RepID=A0A6J2XYG3_SITOR|nr:uncharacterized protein LOC115882023 [Sitophilus oryzae]
MVFGEIVEPTTRALILEDEDLENLPDYAGPVFQWEGKPEPPDNIETLVFIESQKVIHIVNTLLKGIEPVALIKDEGVFIYKFNDRYLVLFTGQLNKLVLGEIVEILAPWLKKAKTIHAITTELINNLKPAEKYRDVVTVTKCLTNSSELPYGSRLETPNLIQGLGATVLTYCLCQKHQAYLWIVYTDHLPLDSMNSAELIKLLKFLGLDIKVSFKESPVVSNLYM